MIETTICIPILETVPPRVLLALKKRGFGKGKVTGVGGKVEAGETAVESAIRELAEEAGIIAQPDFLHFRGQIEFHFPWKPTWNMRSQLFVVSQWDGEPCESEEVAPQFYTLEQIPFANMWADARHWLPPILAGSTIQATFVFADDNEQIEDWKLIQL